MVAILAMIGPLVGAVAKLGEYLANPIKKQVSYLCCYNSNAQTLIQEAEKLDIARQSVQQQVDAAQRNLENALPDVTNWLKGANETREKGRVLIDADNNVPKGCLSKWCPFLYYSSSREAEKTTDAIVKLPNDVKFERVSTPANPANLPPVPDTSAMEFESRDRIEQAIMEALNDNSVYLIGLCGMGGVGKTTMAEKIMYEAKTKTMFEVVVWATVSQPQDLKKVQQQIAEGFGLKLEEESEKIRTEKLHARLRNAKSFLIILDDVWKELGLEKLGIPSQSTTERRKLIITSRVVNVLTNNSNICYHPKILTMQVLNEEEAWSLFQKKAGVSDDAVHLHETAKEVANECKGLPLALVVVGSALRGKKEHSWNDALRQLKRSTVPATVPTILQEVYVPLRWSYDQLQNEEAQNIFLLCCLFPEDYPVDVETLVSYGWGLRIFSNIENLSEARERVHGLLEMLKLRFLLIHAGEDERVKMHDVIRDMAISIASKDRHVFMVNDDRKEWPIKESYTDYTHISVTLSRNFAPPESIDCPKLEFLRMKLQVKMPEEMLVHLFDSTRVLRVLDVSGLRSLLPSSMFGLTNLRALHLEGYDLEMTSLVGKLENLEILNLRFSKFKELPKEVGQLTKLKLLDLTSCEKLREIAPDVISGLVNLEELLMFDSFDAWEDEEDGKERKKASLQEVASLGKLVTLEIHIHNPKLVALLTQKLERFCLRTGDKWNTFLNEPRRKYKKIVCWTSTEESPVGNFCLSMTRNAEYLYLRGNGCTGIINDLVAVRHPEVLNANLRDLTISSIQNITGIFSNQIPKGNFSKLEELEVRYCDYLKNILAPPVFRGLTSLTKLKLLQCEGLEEVIAPEEAQEGQKNVEETLFPHLKELELSHLPKMRRFCHMTNTLKLPSLESMIVQDCLMLESFSVGSNDSNTKFIFNKEVLCPNLRHLKLKELNNAEIFSCGAVEGNFNKLKVLEVDSCFNLRSILTPPMFRGLTSLTRLRLSNCKELKVVLAPEEAQEGQKNVFPFPLLKELELSYLPKMQRFCHMTNTLKLPSLEIMIVEDCPILESFSINKKLLCTNLLRLELKNINGATGLFENRISIGNFSRLKILKIKSCYSLKNLFSPSTSRGLVNLIELILKDCKEVEEVIAMDSQEGQRKIKEILFPKLEILKLIKLPKFHKFCHVTEDLELTSLRIITIEDCPEMETFSLGSLHLPSLKKVYGMEDFIRATKIFFNKERRFEETHMDNGCIKLSVRDLSILDHHNISHLSVRDPSMLDRHNFRRWNVYLRPDSSSSFLLVAELRNWVEVKGKCPMANPSMADAYEIFCVIMLKESAYGWQDHMHFRLTLPEGITHYRKNNLKDKPRGQWLEILVGEFMVEPNQIADFEFSLCIDVASVPLIEGVIIRPKSKNILF